MKLAILSDIHGNLPALEVVTADIQTWGADVTVVNGDIVNRGPAPAVCLAFLQQQPDWHILMGNHEEYVTQWLSTPLPDDPWERAWSRVSHWTFEQLNGTASLLAQLPRQAEIKGPDGRLVRITHASVGDMYNGIYSETPDDGVRQQMGPAPAVFGTGHTHRPLVRRVDSTVVVNVGSAGTTFDGDPRASYARLWWERGEWQAEIVRLAYDRQQAEQNYLASGLLEAGSPAVYLIFCEWLEAQPLIPRWFARYKTAVRDGELEMAEAIRRFLEEEGIKHRVFDCV